MLSTCHYNHDPLISKFIVAGINHNHAGAGIRSLFSISQPVCEDMLRAARHQGLRSLFILSTCNRTELYAYTYDKDMLKDMLVSGTKGTYTLFGKAGFVKTGTEALCHLYRVAAGMDSQIIGDFEILGQLKASIALSRKHDMIGPMMDRTVSFALQASKAVRTHTRLSSGTVSVSYAAIEWLKKEVAAGHNNILLIGTGKFGTTTAKNLCHYFPGAAVTIMNRTDETARKLANTLSFDWKPFSAIREQVEQADIIIACTNAENYTLLPDFFSGRKKQWIMDLSVPSNVHPAVKDISGRHVTGIDEISQALKDTLAKRSSEIPKAMAIVNHYQSEFLSWLQMQRHVPVINDIKNKLYSLGEIHFCYTNDKYALSRRINKAVGSLAMHLRYRNEKGCHYINTINEFLKPDEGNG